MIRPLKFVESQIIRSEVFRRILIRPYEMVLNAKNAAGAAFS